MEDETEVEDENVDVINRLIYSHVKTLFVKILPVIMSSRSFPGS
jgi:hypothetical protein